MRILCILLPHFPFRCESLRNPEIDNRPALIISGSGSRKIVLDHSPRLCGLQSDMPLQQALAQHSKVELIQADTPFYWSVFNRILDRLETRSPLVEGSALGAAYLGTNGLQLIYPDDERLVAAVIDVLPKVFIPRIGIAKGKFPSYLAALYSSSSGYRALNGNIKPFLNNLPCDILPITMKSKDRLHDFGINTLGHLASMPQGPLQSQFGPEGKKMQALARGNDDTPLYPRRWEEKVAISTTLTSVTVSLETMLATVEKLLAEVITRITKEGLGIISLVLWTHTWNSECWERDVKFKDPVTDIQTTISIIRHVMENFPQPGPVEELGIRITRLGYPRGRQKSLFGEIRNRDNLLEDIHQLELRQGNPQIFSIKEVEPWSRIPERRHVLIPTVR